LPVFLWLAQRSVFFDANGLFQKQMGAVHRADFFADQDVCSIRP